MYYATVMVLTTAATVLGVMVLRIHHQVFKDILSFKKYFQFRNIFTDDNFSNNISWWVEYYCGQNIAIATISFEISSLLRYSLCRDILDVDLS